eukprot:scaffold2578_cov129-Isochrysis_galbana.AAC.3
MGSAPRDSSLPFLLVFKKSKIRTPENQPRGWFFEENSGGRKSRPNFVFRGWIFREREKERLPAAVRSSRWSQCWASWAQVAVRFTTAPGDRCVPTC